MPSPPASRDEFEIAIICALPIEYDAVSLLIDHSWDQDGHKYGRAMGDLNTYSTGRMGSFDVVLVLLSNMGKTSASSSAAGIRSSFPRLKLALLTGICGGVPNVGTDDEILLGDVVIGETVIHYDYGRRYPDDFIMKSNIEDRHGRHTKDIRNFLVLFKTNLARERLEQRALCFLEQIQTKVVGKGRSANYHYPGTVHDRLFPSNFRHKHHLPSHCICAHCDQGSDPVCEESRQLSCDELGCNNHCSVPRSRLDVKKRLESEGNFKDAQASSIFVGRIGSGDMVLKSGEDRDKIAQRNGILAFEMEGAGVWDEVPCVIIKGVCDYADSHKNKNWQAFAAATAASAMKALLERYNQTDRRPNESHVAELLTSPIPCTRHDQIDSNYHLRRRTPAGIIEEGYGDSSIHLLPSPKRPKCLPFEMHAQHSKSLDESRMEYFGNDIGNCTSHVPSSHTYHMETRIGSIDTTTKEALLELLYFSKIDERITNLKPAQGNTCRWFLNKPQYNHWYNNAQLPENGRFLWIKGKPGTGKSTLMKLLFSDAQSKARHYSEKIVLSFFFVARGTIEEKSTKGLYRALLHQLFQRLPDLWESLEWITIDGARVIQRIGWSEEALKQTLIHATQKLGDRSLMIFIDALDECEDKQAEDMIGFLEELCSFTTKLQICFSSRHYPHVEIKEGVEIILEGEEGHRDDIQDYIRSKLRLRKTKQAEALRLEILNKSCCIFLWVVLVVDLFNSAYPSKPIDEMRKHLKEIPVGLHDLFEMIVTRDGDNLDQLDICLKLILFAARPLKPEELYFAIQLGLDKDCSTYWDKEDVEIVDMMVFVRSSSKGLAEVTHNKAVEVQFIHESVRDYLLASYESQWSRSSGRFAGHGHEVLRDCCLAQLNAPTAQYVDLPDNLPDTAETTELRNTLVSSFPFLAYASNYVFYHSDSAQGMGMEQKDFISDFPFEKWIVVNNALERYAIRHYKKSVSPLYLFGERNLAHLIRILPPTKSCFDAENERYGPPIFAARATGSNEAVMAFLEAEARTYPPEAAIHDHLKELPQNASGGVTNFGREFTFSPKNGLFFHIVEERDELLAHFLHVVGRLSAERVLIGAERKKTMLHSAASTGGHSVVEILLDASADANSIDTCALASLNNAILNGNDANVKILPNASAVANSADVYGLTASHDRISNENEATIKILLDVSADANSIQNYRSRPLHNASLNGNTAMIKMLLDSGVDVNSTNAYGSRPLHNAASNGDEVTVKVLLDAGAGVNSTNNYGWTPLHNAAFNEKNGVVKMLLDAGADANSINNSGWTPLHNAVSNGDEAMVETFLQTGMNVNLRCHEGETPLLLAVRKRHESMVVRLLLQDKRIDPDIQDVDGRTPLSWAVEKGLIAIVRLLLTNSRVNPTTKDCHGRVPLSYADAYWSPSMRQLFKPYMSAHELE